MIKMTKGNYYVIQVSEKTRSFLPYYMLTYSSNSKQGATCYSKGIPYHHIILTLSGTGVFKAGEKKEHLKQGDIIFYKENVPCEYSPIDNWRTCWLSFGGNGNASIMEYYNFPDYLVFRDDHISKKIQDLCMSADESLPEDVLSYRLYSLVCNIGAYFNATTLPKEFERAVKFIDENYNKDLSVEEIAESSGTSVSSLYRLFGKIEKTTPINYLNRLRIDWAIYFLETSPEMSIRDISEKLGFSSTNYFIATFKRFENTTPLAYRKKIRA